MLSTPGPAASSQPSTRLRLPNTGRQYILLFVPLTLLSWVIFKCCYPYADYFTDSYTYIQAAAQQDALSVRPIGYSLFLRLIHIFSSSDTFLVTIQYALVQAGCLTLFLAIRKIYALSKRAELALFVFLLIDPTIHYLCNYVSSDALFVALSLFWIVVLLNLIRRPSWKGLTFEVIVLILIFNLRFVALFFPAVAAIAFWLAPPAKESRKPGSLLFKVTGIVLSIGILVIGTRVIRAITIHETGAATFSAFSGWQIANNALNMYPYIPVDTTGFPDAESKELSGYVKTYFETTGAALKDKTPAAVTDYMWIRQLPLHKYMDAIQRRETLSYFIAWHRVSVVFNRYGYFLVKKHPFAFGRYYLWPSAKGFFLPPLDVFAVFNEGNSKIDSVAVKWFHYPTDVPKVRWPRIQSTLLAPIPWVVLLLNIIFAVVGGIISLRWWRNGRRASAEYGCFWLAASYLVVNAAFSIFASPTVFRYEILPIILLFGFLIAGGSLLRKPQS